MTSDSLEKLNKQVLFGYLEGTKQMIKVVMEKYNLAHDAKIQQLLNKAGRMISDLYVAKTKAIKDVNTVSYFINDLKHDHYNHLLYTIIPFVMGQDYLENDNNVSALQAAIDWRLEEFDKYWNDMEKGIIKKNPITGE